MYIPIGHSHSASGTVLDIGSGGGEHIESILTAAQVHDTKLPKLILSDLFPQATRYQKLQQKFGEQSTAYISTPLDMNAVDQEYDALMICSALHHFKPEQIEQLFKDVASNRKSITILEISERTIPAFVNSMFGPFILCPLAAIFSPNPKWQKILLTIIPIIPLMFMWDSIVSSLRSYTNHEIQTMFLNAEGKTEDSSAFTIESGGFLYAPFQKANYFIAQRK